MEFNFLNLLTAALALVVFYAMAWGIARFLNKKFGITFTTPSKFLPRVTARVRFYSLDDGWHVTFYHEGVLCNGILLNVKKHEVSEEDQIEAVVLCAPNGDCGFYCLEAIRW